MLFTCIKSWFFRNHLANFHQISHWSFFCNVIDSLFKWSCSIDCQAHIFFFKTKNCSNDDIFISCDDRIGKMLHNICMSAVAMSLRWANRGPWASCCCLVELLLGLHFYSMLFCVFYWIIYIHPLIMSSVWLKSYLFKSSQFSLVLFIYLLFIRMQNFMLSALAGNSLLGSY